MMNSHEFQREFLAFADTFPGPAEQSERESDLVWSLGGFQPGDALLDIACGYGRISKYLAKRGGNVLGVDASAPWIEIARTDVPQATFEVRDMRDLSGLGEFDGAVLWWTCFGRFDDETDRRILADICGLLRPGAKFVLETFNGPLFTMESILNPKGRTITVRLEDRIYVEERKVDDEGRRLRGVNVIYRDSRRFEDEFDFRVLSGPELEFWLLHAGFSSVELFDREGKPFRKDSYNLVAVATK
ncbi:class I SAM-dependent methyltransferase [Micromonospora sp. DT4]|uniref:class I SAM-dependent methyltransferase n=1 Tax=Micromonospora sp. DT4 TaxID=3393438 RepID=UPI003CEB5B01